VGKLTGTERPPADDGRRRAPIVFGHRGARAYAADNTIESFRLALAQGADGIETDAWLSADGVPVLVHDATIAGRGGRRVSVKRSTAAELADLGVPSLADLYRECGTDYNLSVDVEHPDVGWPLVEVAASFAATGRLWLCSEDEAVLADLRRRTRDVRLAFSAGPRPRGGLAPLLHRLAKLRVDVVNLREDGWTRERVAAAHDAGLLAFGWNVQDDAAAARMVELEVDGVYGDAPDRMIAAIAAARAARPLI
jgi:glycerophosphoryl diester phosphodiesterase